MDREVPPALGRTLRRAEVAVFYRHDGQSIPEPGIVVLGRVESAEPLAFRGPADVTFERAE